ncbi:uncharacterized protein [Triticum aestivum]|uniref:uncharacterized protein n=1 Tax=Triticum aestivum TaxID=4565 RepID=UPI001D008BEE|nr:uncharacterized protein LOC123059498 [Triticum aestivum]
MVATDDEEGASRSTRSCDLAPPPPLSTQPLLSYLLCSSPVPPVASNPIVISYFPLLFPCVSARWAKLSHTAKGGCSYGSDAGAVEVEAELRQLMVDGRVSDVSLDDSTSSITFTATSGGWSRLGSFLGV